MSPQECEITRCSPNQLEMTTNSPALASDQCPVPHHTGQLAWLPLGNSRDSRQPSKSIGTPISAQQLEEIPCTTYHRKMRADYISLIEVVSQLSSSISRVVLPQQ